MTHLSEAAHLSERILMNYYLNDIVGSRIYVGGGETYTVTNVHTYTNYGNLQAGIAYECADDNGKRAGMFIVRLKSDGSAYKSEWIPEKENGEPEGVFDISSVSDFLEGIEVISD